MPVCALIFGAAPQGAPKKVRVACVGGSVTAGLPHRESESYPVRLQEMLGAGYEVRNYGMAGATLTQKGGAGKASQDEYREVIRYLPDIVFMEFGRDESSGGDGGALKEFERECGKLTQSFLALPSHPRVILLLPPPVLSGDPADSADVRIRDRVLPALRSVAFSSGCEVVNLYNYLLDRPDCFSDSANLSPAGASLIASRLFDMVRRPVLPDFVLVADGLIRNAKSNYYGFDCYDLAFEKRDARIVVPKIAAKGCPWIWRARFWGHEPQTEIALLERGFHLVYCDVAELFGNDEALGIWNRFYDMLVRGGLSKKAVFEGFSRGGIYMYRWAARNPDRVACVYADAPALDLKSWPGGKGKGGGNPVEWERFKQDFGLASEEEALAFRGNPLDLAPQIAAAGFPMLHVCGLADTTVPVEENTDLFEKKILASGGRITVIRKPGIGHHPHSLPNPQPIVDFILESTGQQSSVPALLH